MHYASGIENSINEFQVLTFTEPNPKLNKLNRISIFDSYFLAGSLLESLASGWLRCNDDMFNAFIELNGKDDSYTI